MNAFPEASRDQAAEAIVQSVGELENLGFNHGSSGNVSVRFGEGMLITPTGGRARSLTKQHVVETDLRGCIKGAGAPSSEWRLHAAIYGAYASAQAVVHTHADACVALSCLRKPMPAFHYMIASFGGEDVRCAPYSVFGSSELADGAVEALTGRTACLLANHGMIAFGDTLQRAMDLTIKLETLARQYLLSLHAGNPVLLGASEIAKVRERYQTYASH